MKSIGFLSESLQKMSIILEEYQAQFQGMAIDISTIKNPKKNYPTFQLDENFVKKQQESPHPTVASRQPKVTYSNRDIADKPPDFLENLLIEHSHNTRKPLGDSFLRKMRKILVDITKKEIAIIIQKLINEGKIIDYSAEDQATKALLDNAITEDKQTSINQSAQPIQPRYPNPLNQLNQLNQSTQPNQLSQPSQPTHPNQLNRTNQSAQQNQPTQQNQMSQPIQPPQPNQLAQQNQPPQSNQLIQQNQPPQSNQLIQPNQPSQPNLLAQQNQPPQPNQMSQANQPTQQNQPNQLNQSSSPSQSNQPNQ